MAELLEIKIFPEKAYTVFTLKVPVDINLQSGMYLLKDEMNKWKVQGIGFDVPLVFWKSSDEFRVWECLVESLGNEKAVVGDHFEILERLT